MKKNLSFLKSGALLGLSLFGCLSANAQAQKDDIWVKATTVAEGDYVTFVNAADKAVYSSHKETVNYTGEYPSTEGTGFYVEKGSGYTNENPTWAFNTMRKMTDPKAEGYNGYLEKNKYLVYDASLEHRSLAAEVSWTVTPKGEDLEVKSKSALGSRVYYDTVAKYFLTSSDEDKVVNIYKREAVERPTFSVNGGTYAVLPSADWTVNVTAPKGEVYVTTTPNDTKSWTKVDGSVSYKANIDKGEFKVYAKTVYGLGETQCTEVTYKLVELANPTLDPTDGSTITVDLKGHAVLKMNDATTGSSICHKIGDNTVNGVTNAESVDLAQYVGKDVTVTAWATKDGAKSAEVAGTYTVKVDDKYAITEVSSKPAPTTVVKPGDEIELEALLSDDAKKDGYVATFNENVETLKLTPDGGEAIDVVVKAGKFIVPNEVRNTKFTVAVSAGAFSAKSKADETGHTVVKSAAKDLEFTATYMPVAFSIEPFERNLNSSIEKVQFDIYPTNDEYTNGDPTDVTVLDDDYSKIVITNSQNETVEEILAAKNIKLDAGTKAVEFSKVGDEGHTFQVKFANPQVAKAILSDKAVKVAGFMLAFKEGQLIDVEHKTANKTNVTAYINFYEDVKIDVKDQKWTICEETKSIVLNDVTGKGKILEGEFDVKVNDAADAPKVTITGTNKLGEAVNVPATITLNDDKKTFTITASKALVQDNGTSYQVNIPKGVFKSHFSTSEEAYSFDLDVLAHVDYEASSVVKTDDEGIVSTIEVKIATNLDNEKKTIERALTLNPIYTDSKNTEYKKSYELGKKVPVTVAGVASTADFVKSHDGVYYITTTADVTKGDAELVIPADVFQTNLDWNGELHCIITPYVTYSIDNDVYVIDTEDTEVEYTIHGSAANGVKEVISYLGVTDKEKQNVTNAAAFNDGYSTKFPEIQVDDKNTENGTKYTAVLPAKLEANNYQLNIPVGTVKAKDHSNANENRLFVNFLVRNHVEITAPADTCVSTAVKEMVINVKGFDTVEKKDATAGVNIHKDAKITIENLATKVIENIKVDISNDAKSIKFNMTGYAKGSYKVVIPASSIEANPVTINKGTENEKTLYASKNKENIEIIINVEDFVACVDYVNEFGQTCNYINTKTTTFGVKLADSKDANKTNKVTVSETAPVVEIYATDKDGKKTGDAIAATVKANDADGHVNIALAKTLAKGKYIVVIKKTAGIVADCAHLYADVEFPVEVVKEFFFVDAADGKTTTAPTAVVADTYDKLHYTRTFKHGGFQALYLPFSITAKEIASDDDKNAEIYRITGVSYLTNKDGEIILNEKNEAQPVIALKKLKADEKTVANKPYVIRCANATKDNNQTVLWTFAREMVKPAEGSVKCATVFESFEFWGNITASNEVGAGCIVPSAGKFAYTTADQKLGVWRWYCPVGKGSEVENETYVKVSIDGMVYDENGEATSIYGIADMNANNGAIYNVSGQKLNKLQKGINIVNGKKILK